MCHIQSDHAKRKQNYPVCLSVCLSVEIICINLHICNPFLCFFRIKFITCKILYITTVHLSYSKDNLFLDKLLAISCIFLYFRHFLPAIKTKQIKRTQDFTPTPLNLSGFIFPDFWQLLPCRFLLCLRCFSCLKSICIILVLLWFSYHR